MQRFAWRPLEVDTFEIGLRLDAAYHVCVYLAAEAPRDDVLVTANKRFIAAARIDPIYSRYARSREEL